MRHAKQILASLSIGLPLLVWGVSSAGTPVAAAAPAPQDATASMPDGPGKAITIATCTKCHSITNVTAQHKDADGWTGTITKMVGYGATGSDEDFQAILAYVSQNYGLETTTPAAGHAKIAVNKETAEQLTADLGLTADESAAVVSYRTKNGDFKTIDDLKKVPAVDGKKFDAHAADLQF